MNLRICFLVALGVAGIHGCKTTERAKSDGGLASDSPRLARGPLKLNYSFSDDAMTLVALSDNERVLRMDRCVTEDAAGRHMVVCDDKNQKWRGRIDLKTMTAAYGLASGSLEPASAAVITAAQALSCVDPKAPTCS